MTVCGTDLDIHAYTMNMTMSACLDDWTTAKTIVSSQVQTERYWTLRLNLQAKHPQPPIQVSYVADSGTYNNTPTMVAEL